MKIIKEQGLIIDENADGIQFNLTLFSTGNYDKTQKKDIVRNTGVRLEVINQLNDELKITGLGFCIKKGDEFKKVYTSSRINEELPVTLKHLEQIVAFFYGADLSDKLDDFENESAQFILFGGNDGKRTVFYSSLFSGDKVEDIVEDLEDDQIANWGDELYVTLDEEENVEFLIQTINSI